MAGEIENLGNELKDLYPPGTWRDMVQKEAPYRAKLKKDTEKKVDEGGNVVWPLRTKAQWNVGIINDNDAFPTAKDPGRLKASMKPELFAGTIQIGVKARFAARSGKSTWSEGGILSDRIEGTAEDLAKYINRVYAGSVIGRLATVFTDGANNFVAAKPLQDILLDENMVLEARTALTGGAIRDSFSGHQVTTIDRDTNTVTYINFATQANDDRLLVAGDHIFIAGSYGKTPFSMHHIVDDGSDSPDLLFNNARSTNPKLKAQILANGGILRNQSEQLILDGISRPRRRVGQKITRALSNDGQARKYVEYVAADRRYPGATTGEVRYKVGYDEESLQIVAPGVNCKLEVDYDVRPRSMYLLSWQNFWLFEARELGWMDEEELLKFTPGTNGYKASMLGHIASIENQGNSCPPGNSRIDDLKDPICGDT
jgi:hypothetical protein